VTWMDSTSCRRLSVRSSPSPTPLLGAPILSAEKNVARRESSQLRLEGIFKNPWRDRAAENALDR
jgi:hypothetical protein